MPREPQPRFKSKRTLARQPAPAGIYESTYDVELGAAICRRIAAGESLRSICAADPSMPTGKTVWNWARAHPEFKAMKDHAFAVARTRSLAARDALEREKRARKARGRQAKARDGYCADVAIEILERLVVGAALVDICRDPAMPCVGTVYNWMKWHPEFLEQYRLMKTGLEDRMAEIACADLPQPSRERDEIPLLRRTVRAAERQARRLSLKRYARADSHGVRVIVRETDGRERVVYDGPPLDLTKKPGSPLSRG